MSYRAAEYVKSNAEQLKPILDVEVPFTSRDIEGNSKQMRMVLRHLCTLGVLERVGAEVVERSDPDDSRTHEVNRYRWNPRYLDMLKEIDDRDDTLPCGHRGHIRNKGDSFGCRYCDEERNYDRETIEEAL